MFCFGAFSGTLHLLCHTLIASLYLTQSSRPASALRAKAVDHVPPHPFTYQRAYKHKLWEPVRWSITDGGLDIVNWFLHWQKIQRLCFWLLPFTYILATFTTQFNFSKVWLEGAFYSKLFSRYFSNFSLWGGIKSTKRSTLVRNVTGTSFVWLDVVNLKTNTVIYHIWMKYWILNCCFMTDMSQQHAFWQLTHDWNSAISTVLANKLIIMETKSGSPSLG